MGLPALLALALAPGAGAAGPPASYPAAGELVRPLAYVRDIPSASGDLVKVLREFRPDFRLQIVHALRARKDDEGNLWYKLSVPMRPNGTKGWVRASAVSLRPVKTRIVIDRTARRLKLFRGAKLLFSTRVAVGAPGMETPRGYFYITAKFRPTSSGLGVFALETSAYSRLTEWPGGGVVGIHGTYQPHLLGQAVSHGCVRVSNTIALRLKRLVPLGTPVRIIR